jgi:hypothetical protein
MRAWAVSLHNLYCLYAVCAMQLALVQDPCKDHAALRDAYGTVRFKSDAKAMQKQCKSNAKA